MAGRPSLAEPITRAPKRAPESVPAPGPVHQALAYSIADAGRLMGVSEATAYRLTRKGTGALRTVLIGGCRRVLHDDLTAYLDGLKAD